MHPPRGIIPSIFKNRKICFPASSNPKGCRAKERRKQVCLIKSEFLCGDGFGGFDLILGGDMVKPADDLGIQQTHDKELGRNSGNGAALHGAFCCAAGKNDIRICAGGRFKEFGDEDGHCACCMGHFGNFQAVTGDTGIAEDNGDAIRLQERCRGQLHVRVAGVKGIGQHAHQTVLQK